MKKQKSTLIQKIRERRTSTPRSSCRLRRIRNLWLLVAIGAILMIVSTYVPFIRQEFPALYGFFAFWAELVELGLKGLMKLCYSIFAGGFKTSWIEYKAAVDAFFKGIAAYLAGLTF